MFDYYRKLSVLVRFLLFGLFLSLLVFFELFFSDYFRETSCTAIKFIQSNIGKCFLEVAKIATRLTAEEFCTMCIMLVFNFSTTYKVFILLFTLYLSSLFSCCLKIITFGNFPFLDEPEIIPMIQSASWPDPPETSVRIASFYLVLFKITFDSSRYYYSNFSKLIGMTFIVIMSAIVTFTKIALGANHINQAIFGYLVGLLIYVLVIHVFKLNGEDVKQFSYLLKINVLGVILVVLCLVALQVTAVFVFSDETLFSQRIKDIYAKHNLEICPTSMLNKQLLINITSQLSIIGYMIGIKAHFYLLFKENEENYLNYHFSKVENEDKSMLSEFSEEMRTRWNHSSSFISLIRLIVVLIFSYVLFETPLLVKWCSVPFVVTVVLKQNLSYFFSNLCLGYLYLILFRTFKLTNVSLVNMPIEEVEALSQIF